MVKLIVYGEPNNVMCILILLEELKLEYTLDNIKKIDTKLNPFGKNIAVMYGERILFESNAILRYIARNNDDPDLTLNDSPIVDQWLQESQTFGILVNKILYENGADVTDKKLIIQTLKNYNEHLSKQKYIAGNEYSIADISYIPCLHNFVNASKKYKNLLKDYPNVYKWFKRVLLKSAQKHF